MLFVWLNFGAKGTPGRITKVATGCDVWRRAGRWFASWYSGFSCFSRECIVDDAELIPCAGAQRFGWKRAKLAENRDLSPSDCASDWRKAIFLFFFGFRAFYSLLILGYVLKYTLYR